MDNLPEETQGTEPATDETTVVPGAAEAEPQPEAGAPQPDPDAPAPAEAGAEPKPSGLEKRISKLVYQAREAERREAYWRGIAEAKGGAPPGTPPSEGGARGGATDGPPKQESFETYDEYLRALTRHEIRTEMAQERQNLTRDLEGRELQGGFEKRVEAVRTKHADFDEVAFSDDHQVSPTMRDGIMNMDDGAEIAYWLGQNHEESNRIARLSPNHQILALGRLSERLAAPPPPAPKPQASAAPPPIKPIRGADGTFEKDPARMTDAEWWRSQRRATR